MERTQEAGEILINSLLLLGTSLSQSSRDYGCEIRQDMFLQPNQKGLNSVFHLLLDRLKGREFIKKELKGAWPVKDSVHQRDFNKVVHKVVMELSHQGFVPKQLASALLQGFRQLSGSRITLLLCYLAAVALLKPGQGAALPAPTSVFKESPSNATAAEAVYRSLRAQTTLERQKFVQSLKTMSDSQLDWTAVSEKLGQEYQATLQEYCQLTGKDIAAVQEGAIHGASVAQAEGAALEGEHDTPAEGTQQDSQIDDLLEAAEKAASLWNCVKEGGSKEQRLQQAARAAVVEASRHPHQIDGAQLLASSTTLASRPADADAVLVDLPHLLQDWQRLVEKYEEVLPKADIVEIMSGHGRTMAPLLAGDQQRQISATHLQHTSRLQSQQRLTESLLQALATAVAEREALQARTDDALGRSLAGPSCPSSPHKDLIRAAYPEGSDGQHLPAANHFKPVGEPSASEKGVGSKAARGKEAVTSMQSALRAPACTSSFPSAMQLLEPFGSATAASVMDPSGVLPDLADSFLPTEGKDSAAEAAFPDHFSISRTLPHLNKQDTPAMHQPLLSVDAHGASGQPVDPKAAPRRLSFSGSTPCGLRDTAEAAALDSEQPEAACEEARPADVPSVTDIMARMSRLRS